MNVGTLELALLVVVALNALFLIALHIIGDVRTMRRRFLDSETKRSGKRDRYRPSLSAVVYHTNQSADITMCLDSLRTNPYSIDQIIVVDMLGDRTMQKTIADYRKQHAGLKLTYRSLANKASRRQQTGAVRALISSKLVMVVDSAAIVQPDNLLPAIKTFRDTEVVGLVGQVDLRPSNSLLRGLYVARQALINNFRRAFSGSGLYFTRTRHPAVILRHYTLRRIIDKAKDGALPPSVSSYTNENLYSATARLVRSADLQIWVDDLRFRVRSMLFVFTMLSFVVFVGFILMQLGVYNSLPIIAALLLVVVVFAGLSQPRKAIYSRLDKISIALLAPFSILLPLVFFRPRRQKNQLV